MSDIPNRPSTDEEWEALMHQLRTQPVVRPRPFFYTRVQARLAANTPAASQLLPAWLRRPAYAALLGALMLVLSGDGTGLSSATATVQYHARPPRGPQLSPMR